MNKGFLLQIFSNDIFERIAYLGRVCSDAYFEIGNKAIVMCEQLDALKANAAAGMLRSEFWTPENLDLLMSSGYMDVYMIVAEYFGKSARTIRYYVHVCESFPAEAWQKFDVLPFSHFEFATQFGDKWEKVLQASFEQMDRNGGRPPSVDWLQAKFSGIGQVESDIDQIQREDDLNQLAFQLGEELNGCRCSLETPTPPEDEQQINYSLRVVARAIKPIEMFTENLVLPEAVRSALKNLVIALREALHNSVKTSY